MRGSPTPVPGPGAYDVTISPLRAKTALSVRSNPLHPRRITHHTQRSTAPLTAIPPNPVCLPSRCTAPKMPPRLTSTLPLRTDHSFTALLFIRERQPPREEERARSTGPWSRPVRDSWCSRTAAAVKQALHAVCIHGTSAERPTVQDRVTRCTGGEHVNHARSRRIPGTAIHGQATCLAKPLGSRIQGGHFALLPSSLICVHMVLGWPWVVVVGGEARRGRLLSCELCRVLLPLLCHVTRPSLEEARGLTVRRPTPPRAWQREQATLMSPHPLQRSQDPARTYQSRLSARIRGLR